MACVASFDVVIAQQCRAFEAEAAFNGAVFEGDSHFAGVEANGSVFFRETEGGRAVQFSKQVDSMLNKLTLPHRLFPAETKYQRLLDDFAFDHRFASLNERW